MIYMYTLLISGVHEQYFQGVGVGENMHRKCLTDKRFNLGFQFDSLVRDEGEGAIYSGNI